MSVKMLIDLIYTSYEIMYFENFTFVDLHLAAVQEIAYMVD